MIEFAGFTDQQLERFRHFQAVSYSVLAEVVGRLAPGVTEQDATRWAMKAYRREGVDRFFHLPVALFGARTALPEPWTTESFWPTGQAVLGHRAILITDPSVVPPPDPSGFDQTVLGWFVRGIGAAVEHGDPSPTWNDRPTSDHRPAPGLWAVEPHLGRGAIGVKWEELLVVEDHDAYWLDERVPHTA